MFLCLAQATTVCSNFSQKWDVSLPRIGQFRFTRFCWTNPTQNLLPFWIKPNYILGQLYYWVVIDLPKSQSKIWKQQRQREKFLCCKVISQKLKLNSTFSTEVLFFFKSVTDGKRYFQKKFQFSFRNGSAFPSIMWVYCVYLCWF